MKDHWKLSNIFFWYTTEFMAMTETRSFTDINTMISFLIEYIKTWLKHQ